MSKPFRTAVVIGRFQPVHQGHVALFTRAAHLAERVAVVVGSAGRPRNVRDPFTAAERRRMITAAWEGAGLKAELLVASVRDWTYNDQRWAAGVQSAVATVHVPAGDGTGAPAQIALVGHEKDATTAYLKMFPQWRFEAVANVEGLSATHIRDYLLDEEPAGSADPATARRGRLMMIEASVPRSTWDFLNGFLSSPHYRGLADEFAFLRNYRRQFAGLKYPPIFVTVDAVTVQSGHVLLVQRDQAPGAGLWALPGGFVEQEETLLDACLRELREETRLKVPLPVLKGSVRAQRAFDHPQRSLRGRTITHAYLIALADGPLPEVRRGSDARSARWVPLSEALEMTEQMFEDHYDILEHFVGQV